jgi:hypothetical protein
VTPKKYGVSVSFCHELVIFAKTQRLTPMDLRKNLNFIQTHKTLYMGPLFITDLEYGRYDQEIQSFSQFLPQSGDFC